MLSAGRSDVVSETCLAGISSHVRTCVLVNLVDLYGLSE